MKKNSSNISNEISALSQNNSNSRNRKKFNYKDSSINASLTKNKIIDRIGYFPQTTKYKSFFDKEGNPFKYFMDIKKHIKSNNSFLQG
jgi:hypothetical protein